MDYRIMMATLRIGGWVKRKFVFPLIKVIKQGISLERLAVSLALGITLGLMPIFGITTIVVAGFALSLRLNMVAMQIAHYIVHPLQLALIIPFLKLGTVLLKSGDISLTVQQYIHLFKSDFWGAINKLWLVNLSAMGIWLIISIPLSIALYYSLIYFMRKYFLKLNYLRVSRA